LWANSAQCRARCIRRLMASRFPNRKQY
jgi:hypothetical protein